MLVVRRILALGGVSALAVLATPTAGAQTPTVTSVIGAADGLSVDIEVDPIQNGLLNLTFGPEPSVTLPATGGSVSDEVLGVDESAGPVSLTAAVLTASAEGALGPQGFATAETTVAEIGLVVNEPTTTGAGFRLQQLGEIVLAAELISATCSADLDGVTGSTTLVGATVLGEDISGEPEPNTTLAVEVPNVATVGVTLNRQVENPDGSLSVTALVLDIEVEEPFSTSGTLEIGPATCGVVEGELPAPEVVPAQPVAAQPTFTG